MGDLADQSVATLRELLRSVIEALALSRCFFGAGLQRRDLRAGAVAALSPFGDLGLQRGEAVLRQFRFARQGLRFGAHFRGLTALDRELFAHVRKLALEFG